MLAQPEVMGLDYVVLTTYLTLREAFSPPVKVPVGRVHLRWEAKESPKES